MSVSVTRLILLSQDWCQVIGPLAALIAIVIIIVIILLIIIIIMIISIVLIIKSALSLPTFDRTAVKVSG